MIAASRETGVRRWSAHAVEHPTVLLGYTALAVTLTWPLIRDFSTRLIGDVEYDVRHAVWMLWYTTQALNREVSWPWTSLLHYPYGINILVDGVGPLNGLLSLPFWRWGPVAAYNGTALAGIALSGWCQYLLVRALRIDRSVAFSAGAFFIAWPIHVIATHGHLEKLFVGLLSLSVLAALLASDVERRWCFTLAPGVALLLALLQNGNQFAFGALASMVVGLIVLGRAPAANRRLVLHRLALAGVFAALLCAPLLAFKDGTRVRLISRQGVRKSGAA